MWRAERFRLFWRHARNGHFRESAPSGSAELVPPASAEDDDGVVSLTDAFLLEDTSSRHLHLFQDLGEDAFIGCFVRGFPVEASDLNPSVKHRSQSEVFDVVASNGFPIFSGTSQCSTWSFGARGGPLFVFPQKRLGDTGLRRQLSTATTPRYESGTQPTLPSFSRPLAERLPPPLASGDVTSERLPSREPRVEFVSPSPHFSASKTLSDFPLNAFAASPSLPFSQNLPKASRPRFVPPSPPNLPPPSTLPHHLDFLFSSGAFNDLAVADHFVGTKDYGAAAWFFQCAATRGSPAGHFNLGLCYSSGKGVPRDDAAALQLFKRAADAGHLRADYACGFFLLRGRGVDRPDVAEGVRRLTRAASGGVVDALLHVGAAFVFDGRRFEGVVADVGHKGVKYLRRAAKMGSGEAAFLLGHAYAEGLGGVKADDAVADKNFKEAQRLGVTW